MDRNENAQRSPIPSHRAAMDQLAVHAQDTHTCDLVQLASR
jgi:hypothetical protein